MNRVKNTVAAMAVVPVLFAGGVHLRADTAATRATAPTTQSEINTLEGRIASLQRKEAVQKFEVARYTDHLSKLPQLYAISAILGAEIGWGFGIWIGICGIRKKKLEDQHPTAN